MTGKVYTLLITESPVIAGLIQQHLPSSVYVISTSGYCWRPTFDPESNRLKAIADPAKKDLRKEMKEQASLAGNVIIATDSDPSGDFICWSVANFLKPAILKRSYIRDISKNGAVDLISEAESFDRDTLGEELQNRYMIRHLWNRAGNLPAFDEAALGAVLGSSLPSNLFTDQAGTLYHSQEPVYAEPGEWIPVHPEKSGDKYSREEPLSTFDIIPEMVRRGISETHTDAQIELQQLFQSRLSLSDESLISYPRTDSNAFYSSTWESLRNQFLKFGELSMLKPRFLQAIADSSVPHEGIHPLSLQKSPDSIDGELSSAAGKLYRLIYEKTMEAIRMPEKLKNVAVSEFYPDIYFYPADKQANRNPNSNTVRPLITPENLGKALNRLGAVKPSRFGRKMDEWLNNGLLKSDGLEITAGSALRYHLDDAGKYHKILIELREASKKSGLQPATVKQILSS
ncbi:MAG: hypothetical protein JJU46_09655 [Balneolaceae bacterium]|nr:hypothetical protein [Balneolaceae bacterium]MCH8547868.1 hypothetical protein [Balneolaceae bacterium]